MGELWLIIDWSFWPIRWALSPPEAERVPDSLVISDLLPANWGSFTEGCPRLYASVMTSLGRDEAWPFMAAAKVAQSISSGEEEEMTMASWLVNGRKLARHSVKHHHDTLVYNWIIITKQEMPMNTIDYSSGRVCILCTSKAHWWSIIHSEFEQSSKFFPHQSNISGLLYTHKDESF